jgi:hypothetical protein
MRADRAASLGPKVSCTATLVAPETPTGTATEVNQFTRGSLLPAGRGCAEDRRTLMKYSGFWEPVPATLAQFLAWVFTRRVVPYERLDHLDGPAVVWTAERYIQAAAKADAAQAAELERMVAQFQRSQENDPGGGSGRLSRSPPRRPHAVPRPPQLSGPRAALMRRARSPGRRGPCGGRRSRRLSPTSPANTT